MRFGRFAGFGAFGFVVIVLSVNIMLESGGPPGAGAAPQEVVAYFADQSTAVRAAAAFAALAWVLIAGFGAGAFALIGRAERARGTAWSAVGLIGIAMLNVMFGAVTATRLALTTSDVAAGTLWHLHNALFTVNNVSLVVVLVGFSLGGAHTGVLRPWHAALGLVSAALIFAAIVLGAFTAGAGPAGLSLIGLVGWLLWLAWLVVFGVVLLRDRTSSAVAEGDQHQGRLPFAGVARRVRGGDLPL